MALYKLLLLIIIFGTPCTSSSMSLKTLYLCLCLWCWCWSKQLVVLVFAVYIEVLLVTFAGSGTSGWRPSGESPDEEISFSISFGLMHVFLEKFCLDKSQFCVFALNTKMSDTA